MAMARAATQPIAPASPALPENSRIWTALYLLIAIPLSLFIYLNAFQEAASFFGGLSGVWLLRSPYFPVLLLTILGAGLIWHLPLAHRTWWIVGWLLLAAAASALLRDPQREWHQLAALTLCAPGLISLQPRWTSLRRHSSKALGGLSTWARNGLLFATAVVLSFVANTLWICATFPEFHIGWRGTLFLASRVGLLAGLPAALAIPALLTAAALFRRSRHGSRLMLLLLGSGVVLAAGLILFNGLSILDPALVRPANFLYAAALALPASILFCERVAAGSNVALGLSSFARIRKLRHQGNWAVPLLCLALFFLVQLLIGGAHRYYEWGFGTSLFYCAIGIGCTWCLLTALRPRLQLRLATLTLFFALLGSVTFLPPFHQATLWTEYTKFDNNLGSLVRAYYRRYPRSEPEFRAARGLLDGSYAMGPTKLVSLRQQTLAATHDAQPPCIFFIVADALRADTYGGESAEHRRQYPGVAWMSRRFVTYANAWSSYNATLGSYPAYLAGVMNPAWYQFTSDWPVQLDNILVRAADLKHYRCYNLATFDDEFARLWPTNTAVNLGDEGLGQGDPAVVFPRAVTQLERHQREQPGRPAFFYLHLYNLHQPLLRRPEVPFHDQGRHWMRALYEQNAAYFDLHLKHFLESLEGRKVLDNALVIITGDHGEEVFDLGGLYHGWQINPYVMRVPLYVHYPKGATAAPPPGSISERPVNLIDVAPTICDVMGVSVARVSKWQGVSLLAPEPAEPRSFLLLSWETPLVGRVSFSPPEMLVLNLESGQEDAFVPTGGTWSMARPSVAPTALAKSLTSELRELFHYWRMDPEHGTYLPSAVSTALR